MNEKKGRKCLCVVVCKEEARLIKDITVPVSYQERERKVMMVVAVFVNPLFDRK